MRQLGVVVPQSSEPSEGEMIFRAWNAKKISDEEYYLLNAQLTFALLHKERPIRYPAMDRDIEQYVEGRAIGGEYSAPLGMRLGAWIDYVMRSFVKNETDYEHFAWCLSKVEEKKLSAEAEAFKQKLNEHIRVRLPHSFEKAIYVQKRDAIAREMEARGRQ